MDELALGTRIADRYVVTGSPLGRGATGVVYPGRDEEAKARDVGAEVALKLLHPTVITDPQAYGRLQRELSRATRIHHPHVLGVRGLVPHERRTVLVTERVDGPSVASLDGILPTTAVVSLGLQLCGALARAHGVGVVHGDIRPGNVLVGPGGARLFDFGLADVAPMQVRPGETPPEMLDGAPPSARSDLYGLGLVLARAALGHDPFRGTSSWARLGAQRSGEACLTPLPLGLQALLRALLHPDPLQRPASALVVRRALVRLRQAPERSLVLSSRTRPAFGIRRTWAVHGIDPGTGGACVFATGVSRGEARRLQRHLDGEGWTARAEPVAFGLRDGAIVLASALVGGVLLPLIGAFFVGALVGRWRLRRLRSELPVVLPACSVQLPARRPRGSEDLVFAGILLLLTAMVGVLSGWLALAPGLAAAALLFRHARPSRDPAVDARRARITLGFQALRTEIEGRGLALDRLLSTSGDLEAMEAAWRAGEADDHVVIGWLEDQSPAAGGAVREPPWS